MMFLELSLFFFVLLGSKVVLGAIAVYMLLPADPRCALCDAMMLPLQSRRSTERVLRALRLQRRWCMECRRETLARRAPLRVAAARHAVPVSEARLR